MANYRYEWETMYGGKYLTYTTRHMPKRLHSRLEILATVLKMSTEMALLKSIEIGLDSMEEELRKMAKEVESSGSVVKG